MDSTSFVAHMELAGFSVQAHGGKLRVAPASKLTDSHRDFIRDHREELLQAITLRDKALELSPPGNDYHPANDYQAGPHVALWKLPQRLVTVATRACREVWNDDDEAVQEMLVDLCWNDPKDWVNLIEHFEAQLPPDQAKPITLVTCSGCRHAEPSQHHPGIMHCKAGVASGAAAGGWQATDEHLCDRREDHHA